MYILKNALKCIGRSKGRNILIGIIVMVISASACIGLSIRQAAENVRKQTLETMSVMASISVDRSSMMNRMQEGGGFDKSGFLSRINGMSELSVEELQIYAGASSVSNFYYSLTVSLNGANGLEAVSESDSSSQTEPSQSTEESSQEMSPMRRRAEWLEKEIEEPFWHTGGFYTCRLQRGKRHDLLFRRHLYGLRGYGV